MRLIGLILLLCLAAAAAPPQVNLIRTQHQDPVPMRGYGRVGADGWLWQTPAGQVSRVDFLCQNPEAARIVGSKYLADLLAYGAVTKAEPVKGIAATAVSVRHGGEWLLALEGDRAIVVTAPTRQALNAFTADATGWQPVPERAYPRYLDNFDNAGLGIWWMATSKTDEQLEWMKSMPVAVNLHNQNLYLSPAAGVIDMTGSGNAIAQIHSMDKPFRHMFWAGEPPWRDAMHLPGEKLEGYPEGLIGRRFFEASGYYAEQVAAPDVNAVEQSILVAMMRQRVSDPDLTGWMEPHGEFHQTDPQLAPPDYANRFPAYLQLVKGYTLATISEAYTGDRASYQSWRDVPYPSTAWFFGRRGTVVDLDDIPWRWEHADLPTGEADGWNKPGFKDDGWRLNRRDDRVMLSQWDNSRVHGLWSRFTHDVPAGTFAAGKPVYLHICPYTEHEGRKLSVWVNGQEVARDLFEPKGWKNRHTQIEVSANLKPGANQFVIYCKGGRISYRVFLSDTAGEEFPFSDVQLSRRFLDWRDYTIWEKFQTLSSYLTIMRSVDPNRPIKVMTPHLFQAEAFDLFERLGAYPQLTGEGGGWYRPMHYKGYARLYGLPGSSEPGGATQTAEGSQSMFANILWESQDCHDYVFDLNRELWSHPKALAWWTSHKSLLRTIGKTDFGPAKVGVLRDVSQDQRFANSAIWNWDLSRGPLPAMGLTPVLIDGGAMVKGRADTVPAIIDCATIVMEPSMVDAIHRYVRQGGVFIAQHHTGEHTPEAKDTWPLATSFGLSVTNRFVTPENPHKWPTAPIHFTADQDLFPSLRGKSAEGCGVAIDYMDNEYSGAIAIRAEGDNVTPIATWDDGTMAVVEVREGYGRFILVGTPFYLRFKDEMGKWFNDEARQKMLEDLLAGVGVKRDTRVTDPRVWFEQRESKNGLYDVYFAGATGIRNKDWKLTDTIPCGLTAERAAAPAVDATADGTPDVATTEHDGWLSFGEQPFGPYQIRQFAIVRDDVGLNGPLHWLGVQAKTWRALQPVSSALADAVTAEAARIAAEDGEGGLDLSKGWAVQVDPATDEASWLSGEPGDSPVADLGAWRTQGFADATLVRYRKQVTIPAGWTQPGSRLILGLMGYWHFGIRDSGKVWLNGELLADGIKEMFQYDVTDAVLKAGGKLDLAMVVSSQGKERGPVGTLYLRRTPAPVESMKLTQCTEVTGWGRMGGTVDIPLVKRGLFGLELRFDVPAAWAGRPVHLVVESGERGRQFEGCIVNGNGLFREEVWAPIGPRVDRWLQPGKPNVIQLYGAGFMGSDYKGFNVNTQRISLEVLP